MKKEFKIAITKKMVAELSGFELATYCCCSVLASPQHYNGICIPYSENFIAEFIYGKEVRNYQVGQIKTALNKLLNCGEIYFEHSKKRLIFDEELFVKRGSFIYITFSEVEKIIHSRSKNRFDILKYFIIMMLMRKYDSNSKNRIVCEKNISYFSKVLNVSIPTISSYTKLLEKLDLIYICRKRKGYVYVKNYYGRKCDKELIEQYASQNFLKSA